MHPLHLLLLTSLNPLVSIIKPHKHSLHPFHKESLGFFMSHFCFLLLDLDFVFLFVFFRCSFFVSLVFVLTEFALLTNFLETRGFLLL